MLDDDPAVPMRSMLGESVGDVDAEEESEPEVLVPATLFPMRRCGKHRRNTGTA